MPGTFQERSALARQIARGAVAVDVLPSHRWTDGSEVTEVEQREVVALALYEIRTGLSRHRPAQRRAMRLLRSLLSAAQLRKLRNRREVLVTGSAGGTYRLHPETGNVWAVERHGRHWFSVRSFCLHEPEGAPVLPPADRTVAHLLMLLTDEPGFVVAANVTERPPGCWDGAWRRRLREARRARAATLEGAPSR